MAARWETVRDELATAFEEALRGVQRSTSADDLLHVVAFVERYPAIVRAALGGADLRRSLDTMRETVERMHVAVDPTKPRK